MSEMMLVVMMMMIMIMMNHRPFLEGAVHTH